MTTAIDDEMLVAFLDGELPAEQATVVQTELKADERLRDRLQKLQSTWDLLGDLPEEEPNPDLARSTIEMVTLAVEHEPDSWWNKLKSRRALMLGLGLLAMLCVGAVAGKSLASLIESKLLVELPTLALMPALGNIDSPQWLETLAEMPNLVEAGEFLIEQKGASGGREAIGAGVVPDSLDDRQAWVESLDETELGRLKESVDEFSKLPPDRQSDLRSVAAHLLEDRSQAEEFLEHIRAYHALLYDRSTPYLTFLNLKTPDQRAKIVKQIIAGVLCEKYATNMSRQDRDAIDDWVSDLQFKYDSFAPLTSFDDFGQRVFEELVYSNSSNSFVNKESLTSLFEGENSLSPKAIRLLNSVDDEIDRRRYLGWWVLSVFGRTASTGNTATVEQLQQAFEELKPEGQTKIELMPERRAREELEQRLAEPL